MTGAEAALLEACKAARLALRAVGNGKDYGYELLLLNGAIAEAEHGPAVAERVRRAFRESVARRDAGVPGIGGAAGCRRPASNAGRDAGGRGAGMRLHFFVEAIADMDNVYVDVVARDDAAGREHARRTLWELPCADEDARAVGYRMAAALDRVAGALPAALDRGALTAASYVEVLAEICAFVVEQGFGPGPQRGGPEVPALPDRQDPQGA